MAHGVHSGFSTATRTFTKSPHVQYVLTEVQNFAAVLGPGLHNLYSSLLRNLKSASRASFASPDGLGGKMHAVYLAGLDHLKPVWQEVESSALRAWHGLQPMASQVQMTITKHFPFLEPARNRPAEATAEAARGSKRRPPAVAVPVFAGPTDGSQQPEETEPNTDAKRNGKERVKERRNESDIGGNTAGSKAEKQGKEPRAKNVEKKSPRRDEDPVISQANKQKT